MDIIRALDHIRTSSDSRLTFPGDLTNEEAIMDFLASPEALELEDQIEEVNAKQLDKLVQEKQFVAVFFCE